jgi:hypothetical protein
MIIATNKAKYQAAPSQADIDRLLDNALQNGYSEMLDGNPYFIAADLNALATECECIATAYLAALISNWQHRAAPKPPPLSEAIKALEHARDGWGLKNTDFAEAIDAVKAALKDKLDAESK